MHRKGVFSVAYLHHLQDQRQAIAEFYRDTPGVTVQDTANHFKVSTMTVRKALREHGVEVDRTRSIRAGTRPYLTFRCPECGEHFRHYCVAEVLRPPAPTPAEQMALILERYKQVMQKLGRRR